MILELYVVLLVLALVLIGLGYYTGDSHYTFVGLFFLFILGTYLFSNNVEYKTGEYHAYVYVPGTCADNCTLQAYNTADAVTYTYSAYTGDYARWFGVLLSISAAVGMGLTLMNYTKRRRNE